jgi:hypothetical protein
MLPTMGSSGRGGGGLKLACLVGLFGGWTTDATWTNYGAKVAPKFWPEGGKYTTSVAVTIDCPSRNGTVHYQTCSEFAGMSGINNYAGEPIPCVFPSTLAGLAQLPTILSGGTVVLRDTDNLLMARCTHLGQLVGEAHNATYDVATGRYGYGYFVPFYNEKEGFSGKLARLDLRSQGASPDFANFQTRLGQGAYDDQLHVLDLATLDPDLKGFMGGFAAVSQDAGAYNDLKPKPLLTKDVAGVFSNYGYLVPHFNGRSFGKLVRVNLDYFGVCGLSTQTAKGNTMYIFKDKEGEWNEEPRMTSKVVPTWLSNSSSLRYYPPGTAPIGNSSGTVCAVDVMDLEKIDPDLKGFAGGFADPIRSHGYLVPHHNGVNATAKVVRFSLRDWPNNVEVLDLSIADNELRGFNGGFAYAKYAYFVPYRQSFGTVFGVNSKHPVDENQRTAVYHGKLVRVDMDNFSQSGVTVLDLSGMVDDNLRGFLGGFTSGRFAYLVQYSNRNSAHKNNRAGRLVRVDLELFSVASVEVLDLRDIDPRLVGFSGGFASGKYGYLAPYNNGRPNYRNKQFFGSIVRVDLDNFTPSGVRVIDLPTWRREQTPPTPDHNLRGFVGGFAAGDFGYFVPYFNGRFYGKTVRLDLRTLAVQFVDMKLDDAGLSGFSGGFTHRDRMICCDPQIGHRSKVNGGCNPLSQRTDSAADAASNNVGFRKPNNFCGSREFKYEPFNARSDGAPVQLPYAVRHASSDAGVVIEAELGASRLPAEFMQVMNSTEFEHLRTIHRDLWKTRVGMGQGSPQYNYAALLSGNRSALYTAYKTRLLAKFGRERFDIMWNDVMEPVSVFELTSAGTAPVFSTCCQYVDQHTAEYVLWDRRAYTRGQRLAKTRADVDAPTCLFAKCKEDPSFK